MPPESPTLSAESRIAESRIAESRIAESRIDARFKAEGGVTFAARIAERGALRLRPVRGPACHGVIVNTAGGIVAGDRLQLAVALDSGADVTLTSVAAEKVYRSSGQGSSGQVAETRASLTLAAGARLLWLPQETILFDRAHLERTFAIDLDAAATLLAVEMVQLGRTASGEHAVTGALRESWRVRRGGRLVFADETRLEGAIGRTLDRPAVAAGGRAIATLLLAAPDAGRRLDPLREALAAAGAATPRGAEAGASLRDGIIVARLVAATSEGLRGMVAAAIEALDGFSLPRDWR